MLDLKTRQLVKATAPALQEHGVALMRHFYARMFKHNPELKEIFNKGNQNSGSQQKALAQAVLAYAENIDNPTVLMPVLERVAGKHVSLGIRKEHYAVVGRHLLASISEVLGAAATPALINAWALAYQQLSDLMSGIEQNLYSDMAQAEGGWTGWRSFRVQNKSVQSDEITTFELIPADGGALPIYKAGQYVSVRVALNELGYRQPRQYSLSDTPRGTHFQISVKRENGDAELPSGMVSNHLHLNTEIGDLIEVGPPAGDFFLHENRSTPVVLISAGVGITPMMAMLEHLHEKKTKRSVRFLHAARNAGVHAFASRSRELLANMVDARAWMVHEHEQPTDFANPPDGLGRLDFNVLSEQGFFPCDADYYLCGPKIFMQLQIQALKKLGVSSERIHAEVFGSGGVPCN